MLVSPPIWDAIRYGRFEEALRLVDEAGGPRTCIGAIHSLDILIRAGRLEEALTMCDDRLAAEPHEYLTCRKAEVLRELGRTQDQMDLYDRWNDQFGDNPDFMADRAVALVAAGRLEEAEETTVRALNLEEYALSGYRAPGDLLMARGDLAGAIDLFNKMIDLDENDPEGYLGKANALAALGERDQAVLTYNQLLDYAPSHRWLREARDRIASGRPAATGTP